MQVIDIVKLGGTIHSDSACVYKGNAILKVWQFQSQEYPVLATAVPG